MRTYEQAASEAALDKATDQAAADATVATAGAGTLNRPDAEETPDDPEDIAARSLSAGTMAVLDPADSGLLATEGGFCTTLDMGICFAAGTPVLMADGTTKPIETLRPGDQVLAAPEHDAESTPAPKTVERVFHNPPSELIRLTIAGTEIRSTPPHLFYVRSKGWTAAQDLQVGDQLRTPDGRWVPVDAKEEQSEPEPVFNFRVADYHTYFVGDPASGDAVLVHNEYDGDEEQRTWGGFIWHVTLGPIVDGGFAWRDGAAETVARTVDGDISGAATGHFVFVNQILLNSDMTKFMIATHGGLAGGWLSQDSTLQPIRDQVNSIDPEQGQRGTTAAPFVDAAGESIAGWALWWKNLGKNATRRGAGTIVADIVEEAPETATELARRLGREGEDAAGIVQGAKQPIPSVSRPGRYRIPDELTDVSLREVKNVAKLSNTSQLRDYLAHAQATGRTFILETRVNTRISAPLQELIDQGLIIHRTIGQ